MQHATPTAPTTQATPTIPALGTILGVWAHPDDEAYLSAGLMALARRHGQRVVVATATLGELGTDDPERWPVAKLGRRRRRELRVALAELGVQEHRWLGYSDGTLALIEPEPGIDAITKLIRSVRPDTIVTFGPDGMTGHPDHRAVSAWTTAAWRRSGVPARLWYATVTPAFHERWGAMHDELGVWMDGPPAPTAPPDLATELHLDGALLDQKLAALRAHASQTASLEAAIGTERFRQWWSVECFRTAEAAAVWDLDLDVPATGALAVAA